MENNDILLDVKNLKTHFNLHNGKVAKAVDGISFTVRKGRTLAIVGESGCGKSQTAFSIMRLVDKNGYHPEGEILFNGENLLSLPEHKIQKIRGNNIGMIFQEPMTSLNPLFRIGNQLSEPLIQHQGLNSKEARKAAINLLRHVGIPAPESRIDNFPHEMSGGMKQRIMIAMALACTPQLLIADEPTTALDVTIQSQILCLMKSLQERNNMGMILITHDLGVVNQVADDVCVMYAGRIAEIGTRDDIFNYPQHPYTRRLLESIPSSADLHYKLHTIPGLVPAATDFPEIGCRFASRCHEKRDICTTQTPMPFTMPNSEHTIYCHIMHEKNASVRAELSIREIRPKKEKIQESLLTVKNLCTHFPVKRGFFQRVVGYVKALDGMNIELKRAETLALVGESGCGKTTAGQSILRLVNEAKGEVFFKGVELISLNKGKLKSMRKELQIVFQDPFASLSPRMKVGEIIMEGLKIHQKHLSVSGRIEKLNEVLHLVGLAKSVASRYPHEFSGGQRQRIAIARALVLEPDFLVLDEPTSALDVSVQAQILNLLEEIQIKRRLAYLFITHNLGVVEYIADKVAVMYLGRIVEYGLAADIFKRPQHPYTQALIAAVPQIAKEQKAFSKIEGDVPSPLNPPTGCHFHPRCPYAIEICREVYPAMRDVDGLEVACHLR